ncbi:MAG: hypothetical protein BAJALOKI2v1_10040 [Promethearchaeota archaeon]|nr:MAG: hypothetical protein BAJALOKI2v1_10040 [Candidatus Lokiarchaeota archaeon]
MAVCRFLGNMCIEFITGNNHFIIDPNYIKEPKTEIKQIFFTQISKDHFDLYKVKRILEKANLDKNERVEIFGPNTLIDHIPEMNPDVLKEGQKIMFEDGFVEVYNADCFQVDKCYGYLVSVNDTRILHTSTSSNFSAGLTDVKDIDYCFISCNEEQFKNYEAYLKRIKPRTVIPYNYNPDNVEPANRFKYHMEVHDLNALLLEPGNELTI